MCESSPPLTRSRPDRTGHFGPDLAGTREERFQDSRSVHNNVAMQGKVLAGVLAVGGACLLLGPRFFAARQTGAGADPSPPNATGQKPAFPGQTRAPVRKADVAFDVVTVARDLENPWSVAFLPGGKMLVTERPGRMRVVTADGSKS